jgi:hypothetical protein
MQQRPGSRAVHLSFDVRSTNGCADLRTLPAPQGLRQQHHLLEFTPVVPFQSPQMGTSLRSMICPVYV